MHVLLYFAVCPFWFFNYLMGKREAVALLCLPSVLCLLCSSYLMLPWVGLLFVNVVYPGHSHLLFCMDGFWA